jgi:hypothetical protein
MCTLFVQSAASCIAFPWDTPSWCVFHNAPLPVRRAIDWSAPVPRALCAREPVTSRGTHYVLHQPPLRWDCAVGRARCAWRARGRLDPQLPQLLLPVPLHVQHP